VDLPRDFLGVGVGDNAEQTVELALRLRPAARKVVIVTGTNEEARVWEARLRAAAAALASSLELRVLSGFSIEEIERELAALGSESVVLCASFLRDGSGRSFSGTVAVLDRFRAVSGAPIFHVIHEAVGRGALATFSVSAEASSQQAADITKLLIAGTPVEAIKLPSVLAGRPYVDWREVRRWGIDETRLPPDTVVMFREPSLWDQYRYHALAVAVLLILETGLIAGLLIQRRLRRRAELEVQRQRMELAQTSRLTTLGELSAAIAHEVNQPLGAISGNVDAVEYLLDADPPKLEDARRVLHDLKKANQRASDVVRRIRGLLRKRELDFEPYDLNGAVLDVVRLLEADAERHEVRIRTECGSLPDVRGDRLHFQQVLLNLIVNGMDAMASTPAGQRHLTIRTARNGDGSAEITVADTGHGIRPADMPRLFDSFFTTKEDGMGLGLALCRNVVRAHGGRIEAFNNPHGGATFRFTLAIEGQVH
jgi:signal transduction histidine kinase